MIQISNGACRIKILLIHAISMGLHVGCSDGTITSAAMTKSYFSGSLKMSPLIVLPSRKDRLGGWKTAQRIHFRWPLAIERSVLINAISREFAPFSLPARLFLPFPRGWFCTGVPEAVTQESIPTNRSGNISGILVSSSWNLYQSQPTLATKADEALKILPVETLKVCQPETKRPHYFYVGIFPSLQHRSLHSPLIVHSWFFEEPILSSVQKTVRSLLDTVA